MSGHGNVGPFEGNKENGWYKIIEAHKSKLKKTAHVSLIFQKRTKKVACKSVPKKAVSKINDAAFPFTLFLIQYLLNYTYENHI